MKSYHPTTPLTSAEESEYRDKAESQDNLVLKFFSDHPLTKITSEDVWRVVFNQKVPITSVRRAVCNLHREEKIIIVGKVRGMYDRPIFQYQCCPGGR